MVSHGWERIHVKDPCLAESFSAPQAGVVMKVHVVAGTEVEERALWLAFHLIASDSLNMLDQVLVFHCKKKIKEDLIIMRRLVYQVFP